ncbi:unnamed protein product [Leuciscus chuanchicus]
MDRDELLVFRGLWGVCEELLFFNCGFKWTGSKGKIVREVVKHLERSRLVIEGAYCMCHRPHSSQRSQQKILYSGHVASFLGPSSDWLSSFQSTVSFHPFYVLHLTTSFHLTVD